MNQIQLLGLSLYITSPFYYATKSNIYRWADSQESNMCKLSRALHHLHSENLRTHEGRLALSSKLTLHLETWEWLVFQVPLTTKAPLSQIHQGSLAKFLLISFLFVVYIYYP